VVGGSARGMALKQPTVLVAEELDGHHPTWTIALGWQATAMTMSGDVQWKQPVDFRGGVQGLAGL